MSKPKKFFTLIVAWVCTYIFWLSNVSFLKIKTSGESNAGKTNLYPLFLEALFQSSLTCTCLSPTSFDFETESE